jgi:hypothetical protein
LASFGVAGGLELLTAWLVERMPDQRGVAVEIGGRAEDGGVK